MATLNKTAFTKSDITKHQKAINKLIQDYAEANGLEGKGGNVVYDSTEMKFNGIKLKVKGGVSQKDIMHSQMLGYDYGSLIGKKITIGAKDYEVTELKPRNKMPLIAKNLKTGLSYRFPKNMIQEPILRLNTIG